MNKKGMTLIELIAVIAIIAILTLMIAPNILEMRRASIRTTIDNKIKKVRNAAITYAEDNLSSVPNEFSNPNLKYEIRYYNICMDNKSFTYSDETVDSTNLDGTGLRCEDYCLVVYIGTLIEQGYLAGDSEDKTQLLNSLDGFSLNDRKVCVRYDTNIVTKSNRTDNRESTRKLEAYIVDESNLYDGLK
jgi:prepilin-type N-terminal cleavage/methylation domain-containing protein